MTQITESNARSKRTKRWREKKQREDRHRLWPPAGLLSIKNNLAAHVHAFGPLRGTSLLLTGTLLRWPRLSTAWLPASEYPLLLRPGTSDPQVFMEVVTFGEYEFEYPALPRTIVDLGANIGITAAWFAQRFPGAHILAVEPDEDNFNLLVKNTRKYSNITPRRLAVWSKPIKLTLIDTGMGSWSYYTRPLYDLPGQDPDSSKSSTHHKWVIDGCTIDQMLDEDGIDKVDILKVDIEGAEIEIFADASAWISRVDTIVIELHEPMVPGVTDIFNKATQSFSTRITRKNTTMVTRK